MNKQITFTLLAVLFVLTGIAQSNHGIVQEDLVIQSKILGQDVNYTIYLPPDYGTSIRNYPVVYLLHGYTDDDSGWLQFGEMDRIAGEAMASGKIPPMIIVMPDGGVSWYINDYKGEHRWEDMFVEEFIPFIEKKYRIRSEKQFRGIAGLSMGGFGSMVLSLRHPDLFVAAAPLSAAIVTEEQFIEFDQEQYDRMFGFLFGEKLEGENRINEHLKKYSALHIVENQPADSTARVKYYFDCGDDDWLTIGNSEMHILMKQMEIPHEYRTRDGNHNWEYWRSGLVDALEFIGESFRR